MPGLGPRHENSGARCLGRRRAPGFYQSSRGTPPNLLAKPGQPWQSSYLYRYSHRLSWSCPPNPLIQTIEDRRRKGAKLLDLTISNPTAVFPNYPHSQISNLYGRIESFAYEPEPTGQESARIAIAEYYKRRNLEISPSQLLITASTSEAYASLFKLFCDIDGQVLVPAPSYPLFEYLASFEGVRAVPYRLLYDGSWFIDFASLRERISDKTRAIVTVNPNNPTGSFLKNSEAMALADLAREHALAIISDEVFMDYAFTPDPNRTSSFIGLDATLSFSLNGLSKAAGMPQMKLAWMAINGPEAERALAKQRLELVLDAYLSVSTPVQVALPGLFEIGDEIQHRIGRRTRGNRTRLQELLRDSPAHPLHLEGGWSAVIQLPNTRSEEEWVIRFLNEYEVVVQPGYFFDMPGEPYIVVSLITPPDDFLEGIKRLHQLIAQC